MRIAFDVGPVRDHPTGVGIFAAAMATALRDQLHHQDLVLIGRRPTVDNLPDGSLSLGMSGGYTPWLLTQAARDVKRVGADIGHFSNGVVPIVRHGKTVLSLHDLSVVRTWRSHPASRLMKVPFSMVAPHLADLVIVPSQATADEVVRLTRTPARKIEVMPYAPQRQIEPTDPATVDRVLAKYDLAPGDYVLALGTLEPRKNHVRLVEAFETLVARKAVPDSMELIIAGADGWHAEPIIQRINRSTVAARIRRLGYVPADELHPLLTAAAVVAYPSLYEGFGLPVVEAMACGSPTVTSNISSMPEVAGDAGFLVDPYDPRDIARGLDEAIQAGSTDRARVASTSMAQARMFTWERAAQTAIRLYQALLG